VPLRIELGPKDLAKSKFVAARRDTMKKDTYDEQNFVNTVKNLLDQIQNDLYLKYDFNFFIMFSFFSNFFSTFLFRLFNLKRAENDFKTCIHVTEKWNEFLENLDLKKMILCPFCGDSDCEGKIKADSTK
jgi:prolyl-tRNA synthetase